MTEWNAECLTVFHVPEAVARQNMPPSLDSCSACKQKTISIMKMRVKILLPLWSAYRSRSTPSCKWENIVLESRTVILANCFKPDGDRCSGFLIENIYRFLSEKYRNQNYYRLPHRWVKLIFCLLLVFVVGAHLYGSITIVLFQSIQQPECIVVNIDGLRVM